MKNVLTKMGYMAIGCLLTLIGYHFGGVENNSVNAQQSSESAANIVDKIRVRQLEIVDDNDTLRVRLDRDGIEIFNAMGIARARIFVKEDGGGAVAMLGPGAAPGAALLDVDENGGRISLWNKFVAKPVLQAIITDKGEGVIVTRDRAGEDTDHLGSTGRHTYDETPYLFSLPRERVHRKIYVSDAYVHGKPDRILSVRDRLVLNDDDIKYMDFIDVNAPTIGNIQNKVIKFPKNGKGRIRLKNGTTYIAPNGCEITNGVITEGQIEVYER